MTAVTGWSVSRHRELWEAATRHPFLVAVRDGTVDRDAFDTWLAQDHRFVTDLLRFQARLLARAPRAAQPALAAGAVALVEELAWFERLAAGRRLDLAAPARPATTAYADLLDRLDAAPYPVALTALWVLERTYLLAWQHASPAAGTFREVVEHWTAPGFAGYVAELGDLVDATAGAPDALEPVVAAVLAQERAFWDMALPPAAAALVPAVPVPVGLSAGLWHGCADLSAAALGHAFVRGLADGSLRQPAFRHYVAQDAYFLQCFARAYALALARSPDTAGLLAFAGLVDGVREELRLHAGYAAQWGVDMAATEPAPATMAYTDFLLATAGTEDVGVTCAAMAPCMRLYAHLGGALDAAAAGPYAGWVTAYADPAFAALAGRLEQLLDRYGAGSDPARVRAAYRRAMHLELAFFDAALVSPAG